MNPSPPLAPIGHQMILASAGSGKTYALTNRFVQLLSLGVPPHRILALTFTRKAAAEFLDEILNKLAKAALDPRRANELSQDLQAGVFDCARATSLLRQLVNELHLLTLGTLDSFFNRILTCFPAEFGLSSSFEILEAHESAAARERVFTEIFRDPTAHREFIEAFRLATFGLDEKALLPRLHELIDRFHTLYLRAPRREQWGSAATIWGPGACSWMQIREDIAAECHLLEIALESLEMDKSAAKMWDGFLRELPGLQPGDRRPDAFSKTLLDRLFEAYEPIRAGGPAEIKLGRKAYVVTGAVCRHLNVLLDHLLACELLPQIHRTEGIHDLVLAFEARYHNTVRRAGKLGFEDVQLLLSGMLSNSETETSLSLDGSEGLLNIAYRLDGQFDHWLLDEFQDTSLPQWKVIENLVDEVIQDSGGQRSFFYVGDVKQAIFGWRGGDSHLFQDIYDYYRQPEGPLIQQRSMEASWRSGPALLDSLNRVFGDFTLLARLFPDHGEAIRRWKDGWRAHKSNRPDRRDYLQLLTIPKPPDEGERLTRADLRMQAVAGLLQEIAQSGKEISCAILVRANDTARELADYLRAHTTVEVMVDGETQIGRDHPLGSSFLALLQVAAHPGDSLAWKHLCMTPALCREPSRHSSAARRQLVAQILALLHDAGFRAVFDFWVHLLTAGGFAPDAFAQRRIELMRQACREFDQGGNRSIPEFVRFAEALSTREAQAEGVVQILTIHKSKGLGFDAVIVAELEGERNRALTDLGNSPLLVHERGRGLKREIDWILTPPRKDICQIDPVLRAARLRLENEKLFEELCLLYVALTRAKFATYVLTCDPGSSASASAVLLEALSPDEAPLREMRCGAQEYPIAFESGSPDWVAQNGFQERTATPATPAPGQAVASVPASRPYPTLPRSRPSSRAEEPDTARSMGDLFAPGALRAADFGTRVHALFEQIEWMDDVSTADLRIALAAGIDSGSAQDQGALDAVFQALGRPEIAATFSRGHFPPESSVWREKSFEMILDGFWISGTFDRVVLADGRAWIFDFKTNRVATEGEIETARLHYAPQMATYRSALAQLVSIPVENITSHLIFTHPGVVRDV